MKAGFSKIDITPPLGCVLNGYYVERYADRVIEPLNATTLAFSDGEAAALAISLDISEILQKDTDDIRTRIAERTGLPFEAIFVACIHTHTAPVISEIRGFFRRDPTYYEDFCQKVCDGAALAIADMQDAEASIARGKAEGISFVRRFRMKDGSAVTNPSKDLIDRIDRPIGTPDESVQLVKLRRAGAPDIAVVQFATHPDVIGGTGICPDWPGFLRNTLEASLADEADGRGVRVIFFNGAQGDVNHIDRTRRGPILRGVEHARHMGRVIAGAVLSIYTYTEPVRSDRVFFRQNTAHIETANGTEEEVTWAKETNRAYLAAGGKWERPFLDIVRARRFIRLEECPPTVDLNVVCVGFGEVAFAGIPGEPFTEIGRKIKTSSPFKMTLPCCNANGSEGYFATDDALKDGGYESTSSLFRPGTAERITETALRTLNELCAADEGSFLTVSAEENAKERE